MVRRISREPGAKRAPAPAQCDRLEPGTVADWLTAEELAALPVVLTPDAAVGLRIAAWRRMKTARRAWCADHGVDGFRARQVFPVDGRFPELADLATRVDIDASAPRRQL